MKNLEKSVSSPSSLGARKPLLSVSLVASLLLSACSQVSIPDGASSITSSVTDRIGLGESQPIPDGDGIVTRGDVQYITALPGDDLSAMASRAGVSAKNLAIHNGLPENYSPKTGEVLAIPRISAPSTPVGFGDPLDGTIDSTPLDSDSALSTTPSSHTVIAGETIFEVARLYNVSVPELARANNLTGGLEISPGQTLLIPQKLASNENQTLATDANFDEPTTQDEASLEQPTQTASNDSGFKRPVSGSIKQGFDPAADEDGYIYSTSSQAPVQSVGEGKVVLVSESTGDQGTVVMVQHPNGLISIYGQMSNLKVSKGQSVSKGQVIGTTEQGELMFQLRRGTSPVDPGDYI